ncbi:MAG: 2-polyprenyl-3-methyl-5-hydroxy-6-metoxy-1,4-benzoquinol methylase [Planctomycetota bacterium]|jgi:2-polyprenyl-3-methyl-5-hydroxy-6-metoxy-1,4-benzoquinol methylase
MTQTSPSQRAEAGKALDACPLCGSLSLRPYDFDYRGAKISCCNACKVRFLNPQPSDETLGSLYASYDGLTAPLQQGEERKMSWLRKRRHRRKRVMSSGELCHAYNIGLLESFSAPGRFLSVGCGTGIDLCVAKERGWQAEGLEIDSDVAATTAESTGCVVQHADLLDFDNEGQPFDCMYLNHVLEHPREPGAWLEKAHELLAPSGLLWIACPNIDSLSNRLKTLAGRLSLKARRGKHYASWHHLFFYSPSVLARLLQERYGFEVSLVQGEFLPTTGGKLTERMNRFFPNSKSCFQLIARKR